MQPHSLIRLTSALCGVPHLITEAGLTPIIDYLTSRNGATFDSSFIPKDKVEKQKAKQLGGIGEICIDGALTYKPIEGMCGATEGVSYQGILEQAEQLISEGVTTIILTHSSPGGQADHCFATATDLREMCDENSVKLISYVDTLSASASLAIGIVADEVIIHPSASTGSIGCVVALLDKSKALTNAGLKPIYISSTPGKVPYETDGSFSAEFLEEIQDDVTRLGKQFANHVSKYTSIPVDTVLKMDAKMFHAEAALEAGLVNKIMDHKKFTAYIAGLHKGASSA